MTGCKQRRVEEEILGSYMIMMTTVDVKLQRLVDWAHSRRMQRVGSPGGIRAEPARWGVWAMQPVDDQGVVGWVVAA